MFSGVYGLAAAIYNKKEVLVCGGYRSGYLKSCHSLDLDNPMAEWEVATELPIRLHHHTMTTIGNSGAVAVAGGSTGRSLNKHIQ